MPRRLARRPAPDQREPRLLVLCPLEFERSVLEGLQREQHGVELPAEVVVEVCGPGRSGIERWFAERHDSSCPGTQGVLLVGTAGGLRPDLAVGSAIVAERIVDGTRRAWTPSIELRPSSDRGVRSGVVLSLESAVISPQQKASLHATTRACAVDLESAAFAEQCETRGWRWGVVRGISDAAADSLPRDVTRWVDARGRLRLPSLLASLARAPGTVGRLPRLRRDSIAAVRAVATIVAAIAEASTALAEPVE